MLKNIKCWSCQSHINYDKHNFLDYYYCECKNLRDVSYGVAFSLDIANNTYYILYSFNNKKTIIYNVNDQKTKYFFNENIFTLTLNKAKKLINQIILLY